MRTGHLLWYLIKKFGLFCYIFRPNLGESLPDPEEDGLTTEQRAHCLRATLSLEERQAQFKAMLADKKVQESSLPHYLQELSTIIGVLALLLCCNMHMLFESIFLGGRMMMYCCIGDSMAPVVLTEPASMSYTFCHSYTDCLPSMTIY